MSDTSSYQSFREENYTWVPQEENAEKLGEQNSTVECKVYSWVRRDFGLKHSKRSKRVNLSRLYPKSALYLANQEANFKICWHSKITKRGVFRFRSPRTFSETEAPTRVWFISLYSMLLLFTEKFHSVELALAYYLRNFGHYLRDFGFVKSFNGFL